MKTYALLISLLLPSALLAHEGHGIQGNEILHIMMSHYYIFIIAAIALLIGRRYYLKSAKKE